jgi:hypothetical protein
MLTILSCSIDAIKIRGYLWWYTDLDDVRKLLTRGNATPEDREEFEAAFANGASADASSPSRPSSTKI